MCRYLLLFAIVPFIYACSSFSSKPTGETSAKIPTGSGALKICKTKVSNAPPSNNRVINRAVPFACVKGVNLQVAPAPKACLSSGFGSRRGGKHKGLDYQSKPAGSVVAAGAGVVVEKTYRRKDMGNWIIIDHGNNVFSGYAHLASISPHISIGSRVNSGTLLGKMGNSGRAASAVHLHYEVRTGKYRKASDWWGLKPVNLFDFPERC